MNDFSPAVLVRNVMMMISAACCKCVCFSHPIAIAVFKFCLNVLIAVCGRLKVVHPLCSGLDMFRSSCLSSREPAFGIEPCTVASCMQY